MPKKHSIKKEVGHVVSSFYGVAHIDGLPHVKLHETLIDQHGHEAAVVIGFGRKSAEAVFFDPDFDHTARVFRTGETFSVNVTDVLTGRILDGFGKSRDGLLMPRGKREPVFRAAPPIIDRSPVNRPLTTGIKVIDSSLPLGRGQRELILGDRKLGKSTIAIDTVLNQRNASEPVICIYVLCGQRLRQLDEISSLLKNSGADAYTILVAATADDSFAAQYLAPFTGCAIGEYFRDNGQDALVVYDDLSKHAKTYRDISLLLERAPGREAYPGDVFSLHAGLLERSAQLSKKKGGGSLSALPIAETQENDITAFIPTNLISITDGQIYLERGLFQKRFLPAVNVGLSVSRVGSKAQSDHLKKATEGVRLTLSQHTSLQKLAQLETAVSDATRSKIERGDLLLEVLKQEKHTFVSADEQAILFHSAHTGGFDGADLSEWPRLENLFLKFVRTQYPDVMEAVRGGMTEIDTRASMETVIKDFRSEFIDIGTEDKGEVKKGKLNKKVNV